MDFSALSWPYPFSDRSGARYRYTIREQQRHHVSAALPQAFRCGSRVEISDDFCFGLSAACWVSAAQQMSSASATAACPRGAAVSPR